MQADEQTFPESIERITVARERPELIIARRDWVRHPAPCEEFRNLLRRAREHGLVVHIVATIDMTPPFHDELRLEAMQRLQFERNPLLRPIPCRSKIELSFGEALARAGLEPIPQQPVAHYFLDFAVIGKLGGLPVRLDVEVDGRRWHEELPGRYRARDEYRNQILRRLGWRPLRFWTDAIEKDERGCIERIRGEASSTMPLADEQGTTKENP